MSDTIVVFTRKTIEQIVNTGGSRACKIRPANARKTTYLVCARNAQGSCGREAHGAGFLIGRITDIVSDPDDVSRHLIQIGKWGRLDSPDLWKFGRNPVHFAELCDLGIDPRSIDFIPMPYGFQTTPLTIAEAKRGLALALGVSTDAINITIRLT